MIKNEKLSLGWRVPFSIIVGVGWLIFFILWLAFYASNYSIYQNIAIFLASILLIFLLIGGVWAVWSLRMVPKEGWEMMKVSGFKWRIWISIIIPILTIIGLIYWFFFLAGDYTWYQNIAVFIVILLIMGGILGVIWSGFKKTHGKIFDGWEDFGKEIGETIEKEVKEKFEGKTK